MIGTHWGIADNPSAVILFLGAHSDDIEIGCGGTVLRLVEECPDAALVWVVLTASGIRAEEASASAERYLAGAKKKEIVLQPFTDGFLPYEGAEVKRFFEALKSKVDPSVIFTHYRADLHQDHRLVNELTWNTFRDHMVCEYEIPKYDADLGNPNFFVPLSQQQVDRKVDYLMECFASQRSKQWFSEDTFRGLMRIRGLECRSPSLHAEAFHVRKQILGGG